VAIEYAEGKSKYKMLVLNGYAGTGKTFWTTRFVEWLLFAKGFRVAISAPTNKAVDVARQMSEVATKKLTFSTMHKLLGLKEYKDYAGRMRFRPDPRESPAIQMYDFLLLDETSMLSNDLFGYLLPFIDAGPKVIFIGDPAQIPPIGGISTIPFMPKEQKKHNMGVLVLDKMHRQADGSPILDLATAIRMDIEAEFLDHLDMNTSVKNGSGIIQLQKDTREIIYQLCNEYFNNNYFKEYSDFMKVIAFHNDAVNAVNKRVRGMIFGQSKIPAIMPGEKLIADSPIKDIHAQIIFSTNAEMEVVSYDVREIEVDLWIQNRRQYRQMVKYYCCTVTPTQITHPKYGGNLEIWIVHESSAHQMWLNMQKAEEDILQTPMFIRAASWREYYKVKETFAEVKYNYAITAHKAQGSSYESCMVLDWDIRTVNNHLDRNRILYTSVTRPRKYLFIVTN
jgi:hypothetical protein